MTRSRIVVLIGILSWGTMTLAESQDNKSVASLSPDEFSLPVLDAPEVRPLAEQEVRAVVLVFVSTDCPIANALQPALQQLAKQYTDHGVSFFQVHSSSRTTPEEVRQHQSEFGISIPVVIDQQQQIARRVGARVTPEAIVLDRQGRIRYRGLINNLYAGYGKKRRQASQHFLSDALEAILAGKSVANPQTRPVGCFIRYANASK